MEPIKVRAITAVLLISSALASAQIPVLQQGSVTHLEDLKGKTVLIRTFSSGPMLRYDSSGTILQGGTPESWMLAGVRLDDVKRHKNVLEIRGTRMGLLLEIGGFTTAEREVRQGRGNPKPDAVTIVANLPRADDAAAIEAAQRIFLTDPEQLEGLVPEYWRGYITRMVGPVEAPSKLPGDRAESPAAVPVGRGQEVPENAVAEAAHKPGDIGAPVSGPSTNVLRVGGRVSPPQLTYSIDPVYVEAARIAKIQGKSVLWIVVGSDGSVRSVRIQRPVGFGLDDNAVAAVKQWHFQPSTKDGQPVSVEVMIDVTFRLY